MRSPSIILSLSSIICHIVFIQFHNLTWECAFGRGVDFSPEKSLALLMENPAAPSKITGAIPHPWQPDHILEDFQEFWENLDSLNSMLGPSV